MRKEALAIDREATRAGVFEATVVEMEDDARALVRVVMPGASSIDGALARARIAVPAYVGTAGDRVLVTESAGGTELYIVGVLLAARGATLRTPQGATAAIEGERIEIRDASGALAVAFDAATGAARIAAPSGDLTLAAPRGKVIVEAGVDLELRAQRDVKHRAARRITSEVAEGGEPELVIGRSSMKVTAEAVDVTSSRASLHTDEATILADKLATTAAQVISTVGRLEVRAERLIEHAKDVYRNVDGLLQTRARRARTLVEGTFQLMSRRASLTSKEETSIDGKRVLLG